MIIWLPSTQRIEKLRRSDFFRRDDRDAACFGNPVHR